MRARHTRRVRLRRSGLRWFLVGRVLQSVMPAGKKAGSQQFGVNTLIVVHATWGAVGGNACNACPGWRGLPRRYDTIRYILLATSASPNIDW